MVLTDHLEHLTPLLENGHVDYILKDGRSSTYLPDVVGHTVLVALIPDAVPYYEDLQDLVSFAIEEPKSYYLHGVGEVVSGEQNQNASVLLYRQVLKARQVLRETADYPDVGKVIYLTPEKIEIPLAFTGGIIPQLTHLEDLRSQLSKRPERDAADFDQRLVLFRKSIREYLKAHPPEDRFQLFLRNFETIYDSYNRDYQLWVGNTFGELEKSFEEKRLKFVADLNGILAGVQASLISVPIAAILLGDKYDLNNPLKDFLLAVGVLAVGAIAFRLLQNQEATLDATRAAINATKEDFEKKHSRRREEFKTRLQNLHTQEQRVRTLLKFIRNIIILIIIVAFMGWLVAWNQTANSANTKSSIQAVTNSPTKMLPAAPP